jgi:hypothetical protein
MGHDQTRHDRTSAHVSVNTHVSRSSAQALAFPVRNVLLCFWITVLLGHPKIHDMYHWHGVNDLRAHTSERKTRTVGSLGPWSTNEKVIGFDVAIDQILLVYCLHTRDLLILFLEARPKFRPGRYHAPFAVRPCTLS